MKLRRHLALNLSHFHHALSLKFEFVFTQVHACECRRTCLCENVTVCKRYGFFSVLAAIIQNKKNADKLPWIENGEGFSPRSFNLTESREGWVTCQQPIGDIKHTWKNTISFHVCCYNFSWGWKSFYNTVVYVISKIIPTTSGPNRGGKFQLKKLVQVKGIYCDLRPAKFIDQGVRTNQIHLLTEIHCLPCSFFFTFSILFYVNCLVHQGRVLFCL